MDWTRNSPLFRAEEKRRRFSNCSTSSTTSGKLAFLNNLVGVFEYEADEMVNSEGKIWEWK
jgi:hypothetical protein